MRRVLTIVLSRRLLDDLGQLIEHPTFSNVPTRTPGSDVAIACFCEQPSYGDRGRDRSFPGERPAEKSGDAKKAAPAAGNLPGEQRYVV